uniref:Serpin domain-containing protein n=4 Tax=Graphocephala atropunctata TaxID=36148 RepID=A0A1B6LNW1_9HEMI
MFIYLLILVCLDISLSATSQQCSISADHVDPLQQTMLAQSRLEMALDLLRSVASMNMANQNIVLSPSSIFSTFQVLYFAASGDTEAILRKFLHLPNNLTKNAVFGIYTLEQTNSENNTNTHGYEFNVITGIYIQEDLRIKDCVKDMFSNEYSSVDFKGQFNSVAENINKWVHLLTRNMITNILPTGYIDALTRLLIVNAVYFKGLWKKAFPDSSTNKEEFHLTDGSKTTVEMMHISNESFRSIRSSIDEIGVQVLELPYEGDDVSMLILLPEELHESAITKLLDSLTVKHLERILDQISKMTLKILDVIIPKFKIEQTIDLKPILETLGAEKLFENADLSNLLEEPESLNVLKAIHTAKIDVDEEDTTPTRVIFRVSIPITPTEFRANHPFVYLIYNKATRSLIISGIFSSP